MRLAWLVMRDFVPRAGGGSFSVVVRGFHDKRAAETYAMLLEKNPPGGVIHAQNLLDAEVRYRVVEVELDDAAPDGGEGT